VHQWAPGAGVWIIYTAKLHATPKPLVIYSAQIHSLHAIYLQEMQSNFGEHTPTHLSDSQEHVLLSRHYTAHQAATSLLHLDSEELLSICWCWPVPSRVGGSVQKYHPLTAATTCCNGGYIQKCQPPDWSHNVLQRGICPEMPTPGCSHSIRQQPVVPTLFLPTVVRLIGGVIQLQPRSCMCRWETLGADWCC
jgi:hypothetical protein